MIQNVLKSLGGIQNYGILSLCLFCAIFSLVIVWAAVQKKTHLDRMARLPLEAEPEACETKEATRQTACAAGVIPR